jgi:hypothetical protein
MRHCRQLVNLLPTRSGGSRGWRLRLGGRGTASGGLGGLAFWNKWTKSKVHSGAWRARGMEARAPRCWLARCCRPLPGPASAAGWHLGMEHEPGCAVHKASRASTEASHPPLPTCFVLIGAGGAVGVSERPNSICRRLRSTPSSPGPLGSQRPRQASRPACLETSTRRVSCRCVGSVRPH